MESRALVSTSFARLRPHKTRARCSSRWCSKPRREVDFYFHRLGRAGQIEGTDSVADFARNRPPSAANRSTLQSAHCTFRVTVPELVTWCVTGGGVDPPALPPLRSLQRLQVWRSPEK